MVRPRPRVAFAVVTAGVATLTAAFGGLPQAALAESSAATPTPTVSVTAPIAVRAHVAFTAKGTASGGIVPGEPVALVLQRPASGGWVTETVVWAATDDSGRFSARVTPPSRGHRRVVATLGESAGHLEGQSPPVSLKVVGWKVVALTFDDGPRKGSTDKIVATLKKYDVQATFFMIGGEVRRQKARARSVVKAGNLAAVHGDNHAIMVRKSRAGVRKDLARTRKTIASATGETPRWFRPPYGSTNAMVKSAAKSVGLRQVLWTVDPLDWRDRTSSVIASRVIKRAKNGSVVLLHDGAGSATVAAVPAIIKALRKKGYDFVTLDELAALGYRIR